ncbi:MAG: hypothetical protein DSO04_04990, partial [Hadesarchaea archaeon]
PAYEERRRKLEEGERRSLLKRFRGWGSLLELQREIGEEAGVPPGYVLLDVPLVDLFLSEPRIGEVEIPVLVEGSRIRLSQLSSIAGALKEGATPRYLLRVLTLPKWRGRVRRAALKIL